MTDPRLIALALASERMLFPEQVLVSDAAVTAKTLLRLDQDGWLGAVGSAGLALEPIQEQQAWQAYAAHRVEVEQAFGLDPAQARAMVDVVRGRVASLGLRMFFAVVDGVQVGAVGSFPVEVDGCRGARLQEVDVFPAHQGRGYGNAMLATLATRLQHNQRDVVLLLGADEDDWPLAWYRRHGFIDVCRVRLTR